MPELLAHLFGDYVFQNHTMALRKTSASAWAALHVALYLVPFLLLTRNPVALAVIGGTHYLIDRYRLSRHWCEFWGVGSEGLLVGFLADQICKIRARYGVALRVQSDPAPPFLGVWLLIIVDNTFHLLINHLTLMWL